MRAKNGQINMIPLDDLHQNLGDSTVGDYDSISVTRQMQGIQQLSYFPLRFVMGLLQRDASRFGFQ